MEFARRQDDPGMMMEALFMSAVTMLYRGDFAGARANFTKAVAEYDDRERTRSWATHTSHNAGVTCRSNLAISLWHLGYPDQALSINREMRQLAREIGHPYSLAYALHHTGWLCQHCRLGAEVRSAADEEIAIASEQGFALWNATGTFYQGAGLLLLGRPAEEALPLILKSLDAFRGTGARLTLPFQLSILVEAFTRVGRFADAMKALDEGLALTEETDERCQEAELHRLQGELLLAWSGDRAAAEECFRQAIETARRQHSRSWELRATMSLARLWRQGRRDEARKVLAAVYGTFTEGFSTPDLVDARALLKALA
jgi:tetratricopeptide (TPR) repeat protein